MFDATSTAPSGCHRGRRRGGGERLRDVTEVVDAAVGRLRDTTTSALTYWRQNADRFLAAAPGAAEELQRPAASSEDSFAPGVGVEVLWPLDASPDGAGHRDKKKIQHPQEMTENFVLFFGGWCIAFCCHMQQNGIHKLLCHFLVVVYISSVPRTGGRKMAAGDCRVTARRWAARGPIRSRRLLWQYGAWRAPGALAPRTGGYSRAAEEVAYPGRHAAIFTGVCVYLPR